MLRKQNNIHDLTLKDCDNCTQLPPLGRLPFLTNLRIENMDEVEEIGLEFYGIRTENGGGCVEGTFLELKVLHIHGMAKSRKWDWSVQGDRVSMPSLTDLFLQRCPNLNPLQQNIFPPTLDERHIRTDCPGLLQIGTLQCTRTNERETSYRGGFRYYIPNLNGVTCGHRGTNLNLSELVVLSGLA